MDGGYSSLQAVVPVDAVTEWETRYMKICRTRHETINTCFKKFASIGHTFTRNVDKHALFAHSIINVVQVGIMCGEINLFDVHDHVSKPETWPMTLPR